MNTPETIEKLAKVIRVRHKCAARHVVTAEITEALPRNNVWQGRVAIFELIGHPAATRCYAWLEETPTGKLPHAVLEQGNIVGPHSAVVSVVRR